MSTKLPEPIENYFRYTAEERPKDAADAFTPTATIFDQGEDLEVSGRESILPWLIDVAAKYKTTREIVRVEEADGEFAVTTLVSGNFPGSPAEFKYRFALHEGLIDRLTIEFIGFR